MLDDIHTYTQCIGITYGNTHVHLAIHTYIQLLHADEDGDGEVNFTEFLHALGIKDEAARLEEIQQAEILKSQRCINSCSNDK